jgi:hypothetical protein
MVVQVFSFTLHTLSADEVIFEVLPSNITSLRKNIGGAKNIGRAKKLRKLENSNFSWFFVGF